MLRKIFQLFLSSKISNFQFRGRFWCKSCTFVPSLTFNGKSIENHWTLLKSSPKLKIWYLRAKKELEFFPQHQRHRKFYFWSIGEGFRSILKVLKPLEWFFDQKIHLYPLVRATDMELCLWVFQKNAPTSVTKMDLAPSSDKILHFGFFFWARMC